MKRITAALLAGVTALAFASSVAAADLIIEDDYIEPIGVVDVGNWDGPYIGVHVGWGWGDANHIPGAGDGAFPNNDVDLSGLFAGVQAGANFSVGGGPLVFGIEGDASWSGIEGTCTLDAGGFVFGDVCGIETSHAIDWMASLRGNIGFDAGAFMPYLTAGVVGAGATRTSVVSGASDSQTHVGWTVGAGVRVAASESVSLDFQYRYNDLGEKVYDTGGIPPNVHLTVHTFRAGVNFEF
jgi:outer membrane immunogenic protein